jgi:hypothetical protein
MKKHLLLTAFAAAEFLSVYAEPKGFDVGTDGEKVEITNSTDHKEIEMGKENSHMDVLKAALGFCDDRTAKRAAIADFRLFAEREDFLDSLPETPEIDEDEDEEDEMEKENHLVDEEKAFSRSQTLG